MINNKKNKTKKEIGLITVGAIIVLMIAMLLCFKSIKSKEEYVMHYSDSSELDYNVYLKKNDFYTTPYLPKDRVYVSTLIDYVDASFNYDFDVVEDINLGYKYYISAKVVVDGNSGKKIFEKEDILLDQTEIQQVQDKNFSIAENVKIDYNKYNQLASSFINKYDIAAKANVVVSMFVDVSGTYEKFEKELNDSAVVSFEIPLTANTTEIKMNYDLKNDVNEKFEYGKTSIVHPVLFVFSILIAILDITYLVYEIVTYTLNKDVKIKYQERLKKIFRDYGPYISKKAMNANTKEIMYTMSLRVEIVDSFDDLINVRDSIEKPILFYESVPGEQAVFYIIDTKVSYIYIMNAKDCGKKKKVSSSFECPLNEDTKELATNDTLIDVENEEAVEVADEEIVQEEEILLNQDEEYQEVSKENESKENEIKKEEAIPKKEDKEKAKKKKKKKKSKSKKTSQVNE